MPRTFKIRNIPCPYPQCSRLFTNRAGLTNHIRSLHRYHRLVQNQSQARLSSGSPESDDEGFFGGHNEARTFSSPSRGNALDPGSKSDDTICTHEVISGRPCDRYGNFLPNDAPPPPWDERTPNDFTPFENRSSFKLADLLYRKVQMSEGHISELMQIMAEWAQTVDVDTDPPFPNARCLYATIDAIPLGHIPWQSFSISYDGDIDDEDDLPWKRASYDIWFRDPCAVVKTQLGNRDFVGEMDFSPKRVQDSKTNARRYRDFMSGDWAWRQADILAQDDRNNGATFCPIILGSDKTTVSVATGQNEYYPLYMSNGLIHNTVRRAHRNGVSLIAFLAIPKTDRSHHDSDEFRQFRRQLFHESLRFILGSLKPGMSTAEVVRYADGYYRRTLYGLGPYIADYPEQAFICCIVQGWCPKCTAKSKSLDGMHGRRTRELTDWLMGTLSETALWDDYGIVDGIKPFTDEFPRTDIYELIAPDILHQLVKGTFKDHLVTWVEQYIKSTHPPNEARQILSDIDKRIAITPHFPCLRRFHEGRGFKQWTGDDSKALMKVYLPAIYGHVPAQMVRAISAFLDFCYLVRREVLSDYDIDKLDQHLATFHREREIFRQEGIREAGFNLPRQHSLVHYRRLITEFGAPNGLCSSITESKHIKAVKEPWRRSNRFKALSQMLLTNQRIDKLAATRVEFQAHQMLEGATVNIDPQPGPHTATHLLEDDEGDAVDGDILGEVSLARESVRKIPRQILPLSRHLRIPELSQLVSRFLYEQKNPDSPIPIELVAIEDCPRLVGKIYVYTSAVAIFRAPSDVSGTHSMRRERIRSVDSWWDGPACRDCVFLEHNPDLVGFQGLYVVQIEAFLKIVHERKPYPCTVVSWFSTVGDAPCSDTGMWTVKRDLDEDGNKIRSIVHLDTVLRGAHLIGITGRNFLPSNIQCTDTLDAFKMFFVNKYVDYHAHEIAF